MSGPDLYIIHGPLYKRNRKGLFSKATVLRDVELVASSPELRIRKKPGDAKYKRIWLAGVTAHAAWQTGRFCYLALSAPANRLLAARSRAERDAWIQAINNCPQSQ